MRIAETFYEKGLCLAKTAYICKMNDLAQS